MALFSSPRRAIGEAQVAQVCSFAAPVADFLGNAECLLVKVDGLVHLTEVGVGAAQIAQVIALRRACHRFLGQWPAPAGESRWPCFNSPRLA